MRLAPATNLDDLFLTLDPKPLRTAEERDAYYEKALNALRGADPAARLVRYFRQRLGREHAKAFVVGHPGVGKTSEIYRALDQLQEEVVAVTFSAPHDLPVGEFRPHHILLVIAVQLMETINKMEQRDEIVEGLSEGLLTDIRDWFAAETTTVTRTASREASVEAEATAKKEFGLTIPGLFKIGVELGASAKANLKHAAQTERSATATTFRTPGELLTLVNRLLEAAGNVLKTLGKHWVVVGEDFNKPGIPPASLEDFFLRNSNLLTDLEASLIFDLPIALMYSDRRAQLPDTITPFMVYDTPVFNQKHEPNEEGCTALVNLLHKRVAPDLFAADQATHLAVASGGNVSDLFRLTLDAADHAALGGRRQIAAEDVTHAIHTLRKEFIDRLGVSPYDPAPITYEVKAARLLELYDAKPGCDVADPTLHVLLRARVVQEFNSERWFGLPPMTVEVLKRHEKLAPDAPGGCL